MTVIDISSNTTTYVPLSNGDSLIVTTTGSINVINYFAVVVSSNSTNVNIDNSGTILSTYISGGVILIQNVVTIDNLNNYNTISNSNGYGIFIGYNSIITTLNNFGTINGTISIMQDGNGRIGTLNNLQNGLTFDGGTGYLPINYNIIINSLSQYGQFFNNVNRAYNVPMIFGIYTPSILSSGSYTSVLTGINTSQISNLSGTYGIYNWSLIVRGDGTTWDLQVTTGEPAVCISYPDPPRLWSRAMTTCITSVPVNALNMRRKAEILKYKANSAQLTKKQKWAQIVHGGGPLAKKVWATQNALGSNPNIENLPLVGNVLQCNGSPLVQCSPSTACDVPGPTTQLCDDPNVPLTNYIVQRTYLAGGTKFPQTCWAPGDNGFPVGKAGKLF